MVSFRLRSGRENKPLLDVFKVETIGGRTNRLRLNNSERATGRVSDPKIYPTDNPYRFKMEVKHS